MPPTEHCWHSWWECKNADMQKKKKISFVSANIKYKGLFDSSNLRSSYILWYNCYTEIRKSQTISDKRFV